MPNAILTTEAAKAAKPGATRYELPDGKVRGLFLIVQPSGAKSWALRYRVGGKTVKLTLGAFDRETFGVKPARDAATAALAKRNAALAAGGDAASEPAAAKRAAKAAAKAAASNTVDNLYAVETVVADFLRRHAKVNTRERSWREAERVLNREVLPAWKGRDIRQLAKPDVIRLLDGVVDRGSPIMANRVLAHLRKLLNWACERGLLDVSPAARVKPPSKAVSRDRILSDDELAAVWTASEGLGWPFAPFARLMILTGQRRQEVAEMRWEEIDLAEATWTLPASRAKNHVEHRVPLSPQALAILQGLPHRKGLVFTTTGTTPISGFSRARDQLDAGALAILREEAEAAGRDPAEVEALPRWTLHDLRRTLASGLAPLGVQQTVVEKILNHVGGSLAGVSGIYQRYTFDAEKRVALDAWGRHVEGLTAPPAPAKVLPFARR